MENGEFLDECPWFASELTVCTTYAIEILEKESISASNSSNHVLNQKQIYTAILTSSYQFQYIQ
jgi:hypothetical protein